jgi:LPXTG-site transpeptidase (sortase) family protein
MSSKTVSARKKEIETTKKVFPWNIFIGGFLVIIALFIPLNTFSPVLKAEISYQFSPKKNISQNIVPVDPEFSLIIPKINANSKVIKNVDPFNSKVYQKALTQGVAHASGSATPDKSGNVFIFAHSAGNWYQANQYNAVFYLLNKLVKGDIITIYYQKKPYNYVVDQIKFVNPNEINYLSNNLPNQLTLMTCWPPGTTLKRLIVIAHQL